MSIRALAVLSAAVIVGALQASPAEAHHFEVCVGAGSVRTSSPSSIWGGGGTLSGSLAGGCAPPVQGFKLIPLTLNPCGGMGTGTWSTADGHRFGYAQSDSVVLLFGDVTGVVYLTDDPTVPGDCLTGTSDFLAAVQYTYS